MDWTDTWRDAFRTELRAEAIGFACHGWPVVPGSYPQASAWAGQDGGDTLAADGPAPVHEDFPGLAGSGPERVAALWDGRPFSVLLATGFGVDALDLPAELGRATAIGLRVAGLPVPIAANPAGRWLFPVAGGAAIRPELAGHPGVVLHGRGSWAALPPSPLMAGVVHWRVKPDVCGWQLPRLADVEHALLDAVHGETDTHRLARGRS
ncbi:MAG: DNA primase [Pseudonocardiaceae bacterium]|nr:DNA primase [Pseudonocardiaceae bacterium]